jgi:hypothetical protein
VRAIGADGQGRPGPAAQIDGGGLLARVAVPNERGQAGLGFVARAGNNGDDMLTVAASRERGR